MAAVVGLSAEGTGRCLNLFVNEIGLEGRRAPAKGTRSATTTAQGTAVAHRPRPLRRHTRLRFNDRQGAHVARAARPKADTEANLGFEAKLWQAADALRDNMDAAEYKHVVLGLISLKYISDAFEAKHAELEAERAGGADPEDPDEYRAASIFWVRKEARWSVLKASAPQPTIGTLVDDAMAAIERDNPSLKGDPVYLPAILGQLPRHVDDEALRERLGFALDAWKAANGVWSPLAEMTIGRFAAGSAIARLYLNGACFTAIQISRTSGTP